MRRRVAIGAAVLVVLALTIVVVASNSPTPHTVRGHFHEHAGWTELATVLRPTSLRASATGPSVGVFDVTWHGQRLFAPVLASSHGWLEVRLPGRPNGSVGWINARVASLVQTPYRIVVNLATRHLALYRAGHRVLDAPAGIGTPTDPTPTGHFYLGFFAAAPSPAWGPFVMVTTAHSNTIADWEDSGDALVAIHGPLGEDAAIGTTGAAISHGCIRLHDQDLARLRAVPDGSPIDILSS